MMPKGGNEQMRTGRIHIRWTIVAGAAALGLAVAACASGGSSAAAAQGGKLGTRTITGIGPVLTSPSGRTLYHITTDANGRITCTGSCATTWPPLLASSGNPPGAPSGLAAMLGTVTRPEGTHQVTFDGMPLYIYSGDSAPGQANGQGIGGVWFAVTPSGSGPAGSPSASPTGGSGYGGRYGG